MEHYFEKRLIKTGIWKDLRSMEMKRFIKYVEWDRYFSDGGELGEEFLKRYWRRYE